jgi:hypothetical protein
MRFLLATVAAASLVAVARAQCTNLGIPQASGCGNSTPFEIPTISCSGSPTLGNAAFAVGAIVPCASSAPILVVGTCLPSPAPLSGPFGVGGFCGPAMSLCIPWVGPTIYGAVPGVAVTPPLFWTFPIPIPNDPTVQGANVCIQEANLCGIPGGFCIGASQGISVTVI